MSHHIKHCEDFVCAWGACLQSLLKGCSVQDVDSPPSSSVQYDEDVSRASNALFGAVLQGPKPLAPPADPHNPTGTGKHL